jgi:hypothetical protein
MVEANPISTGEKFHSQSARSSETEAILLRTSTMAPGDVLHSFVPVDLIWAPRPETMFKQPGPGECILLSIIELAALADAQPHPSPLIQSWADVTPSCDVRRHDVMT